MSAASAVGEDWRPCATFAALRARAALLAGIRDHFATTGALEVETPILSAAAVTDPALASLALAAAPVGPGAPLYLHTSPEFPMKRLLAAGSGPIYQIARVFRGGERGRLHHPEFTLLEWYRPGWDHWRLMDEVAQIVRRAIERPELAVEHIAYRDLFRDRLGVDPWRATDAELRACAAAQGVPDAATLQLDHDGWLDLLLSQVLQARLGVGCLTFLHGYPPSQAALARIVPEPYPHAERFELYLDGIELANGFHELTDPAAQRARFEHDLCARRALGQATLPPDEHLLAALAAGLPDCAGVALGLDRLLMRALGLDHIDQVLAFPVERA